MAGDVVVRALQRRSVGEVVFAGAVAGVAGDVVVRALQRRSVAGGGGGG